MGLKCRIMKSQVCAGLNPVWSHDHHIRWSSGRYSLSSIMFQLAFGWHHCRTQYVIGPRNWSTVMWPAPIGWWRRVSPAINTTQAQSGSVYCLVLWELVRAWGSTPPSAGSTVHHRQQPLLRDSPPVERARPLYIPYCVLLWRQPNPARRSGAPGDTRYSCVIYIYKGLVMYSWINVLLKLTLDIVLESFHNRDLKYTGSCDEPGAGAPLVASCTGGKPLGRVSRKKVQTSS